jgi:hypothetical protein
MRYFIQILPAACLLLLGCISAEYNYDKPQIPFNTAQPAVAQVQLQQSPVVQQVQPVQVQQQQQGFVQQVQSVELVQQQQVQQQQQPFVQQQVQQLPVQHVPLQKSQYYTTTATIGNGNKYIIETTPSRQIYEATYWPTQPQQLQPQAHQLVQQQPAQQQAVAQGYAQTPFKSQAAVVQQQQQQQQQQAYAPVQQQQQVQHGVSYTQQQQQVQQVASYAQHPQQQQLPQAVGYVQQQQPPPQSQQSAQYFGAPQQNIASYSPPLPQQQYATNFGQPNVAYNVGQPQARQFTTPNNNPLLQQQQIGYTAASANQFAAQVAANVATQFGQQAQLGHYVAQSQATQLDNYPYKQLPPGETRGFQRLVKTCNSKGQCSEIALGPGQEDPIQQQLIYATRARIEPISQKCQQQVIDKAAASYAGGSYYRRPVVPVGPARPKDRRLFPYSEVALPGDPYN